MKRGGILASESILKLSELSAAQVTAAGGKGASLGELTRAGVPVPQGFVVLSTAFQNTMRLEGHSSFIESMLHQLSRGELDLDAASSKIAGQLETLKLPDDLAAQVLDAFDSLGSNRVSVRSSATCEDGEASAWAGQLETYLDVRRDQVVDRVRECWRSMFRPSALAYGAAHGYGAQELAVAVVVQHMVASEVSGIAFSVHPVTQEPDLMLIEACYGVGEAIVSGRVVPDQYVVQRDTQSIVQSFVGDKREGLFIDHDSETAEWRELGARGSVRKLDDQQVLEYGQLLARIEEHFGFPVDTEWAIEGGKFQVLQARPITTLAPEYKQPLLDMSAPWARAVRRPVSMVEASIIPHWLDTPHAGESLGFHIDRAAVIQDADNTAILFIDEKAAKACHDHVLDLLRHDRRQVIDVLERGESLYREARPRIEKGADAFRDLDEAVAFFADVAQHTTGYPYWVLSVCEEEGIDDAEVRGLAEDLRSRTLYPEIMRRIIDPLVSRITARMGFSAPEEASHVVTWRELQQDTLDVSTLESRLESVQNGSRFVFQMLDGRDHLDLVSQTGYLIMRLEKRRQLLQQSGDDRLVGHAAWPGVYQGRARVIVSPDVVGQDFEDGEVIVSIQSSPALMPFLQRCGAIVTDDGGIACHAAIIARELQKPTVIGTSKATSTIHTGDLVEVDAYAQEVRILERGE